MALSKRDFEARPEQLEMAQSIARAIEEKSHLLVEAGTGTGKSYAYLVPMILWALDNKKRVLIATGTKALQQQLVERDLPFLRDVFKRNMGRDFAFSLCLGTNNYLCPRRLAKAQVAGLFASTQEVEQLDKIQKFGSQTKTGRNLDMSFEPMPGLWSQVNRESDLCMNRACPLYDQSFFWKARREAEKAQILVANHHLLFAHIAAGGNASGVLPAFDAIVIDEAHVAEDVAASYLGVEISNLGLAKLIELIANKRSQRTVLSGAKFPSRGAHETQLHEAAASAREAVGTFFENLQYAFKFDPNRSTNVRMRRKNELENNLSEPFERLENLLMAARKESEAAMDETLMKELEGFANRCAETRKAAKTIVEQSLDGYVYWTSSVPRLPDGFAKTARVPRLSLHGAPIEVGKTMREALFNPFRPVIMTSATLTTGGDFEFLLERLGLSNTVKSDETAEPTLETTNGATPKIEAKIIGKAPQKNGISSATNEQDDLETHVLTLGSPFDYRKNTLIYVAGDLPDPSNLAYWEEAAIKRAAEIVKRTQGRAFILCTSFKMVDATARFLEKVMPQNIRVLRQGEMARGRLLDEFRSDISSVLVGTTSFWQGVDVPGESLSCVIITKLPFAPPDEPMVQARVETIKNRGRDAFNEYQVPQAVMMFRQGFGRLIRTASDRGIVAILDPRVKSKPYGAAFLKSLPDCEITSELEKISLFLSGI